MSVLEADRDASAKPRGGRYFSTRAVVKILVIMVVLLPALNGCAALLDGKFVTKDGKESPFQAVPDKYAPPKDPTARF